MILYDSRSVRRTRHGVRSMKLQQLHEARYVGGSINTEEMIKAIENLFGEVIEGVVTYNFSIERWIDHHFSVLDRSKKDKLEDFIQSAVDHVPSPQGSMGEEAFPSEGDVERFVEKLL